MIIVINNRNYSFKGIIDSYDFCHNRVALINFIQVNIFFYSLKSCCVEVSLTNVFLIACKVLILFQNCVTWFYLGS